MRALSLSGMSVFRGAFSITHTAIVHRRTQAQRSYTTPHGGAPQHRMAPTKVTQVVVDVFCGHLLTRQRKRAAVRRRYRSVRVFDGCTTVGWSRYIVAITMNMPTGGAWGCEGRRGMWSCSAQRGATTVAHAVPRCARCSIAQHAAPTLRAVRPGAILPHVARYEVRGCGAVSEGSDDCRSQPADTADAQQHTTVHHTQVRTSLDTLISVAAVLAFAQRRRTLPLDDFGFDLGGEVDHLGHIHSMDGATALLAEPTEAVDVVVVTLDFDDQPEGVCEALRGVPDLRREQEHAAFGDLDVANNGALFFIEAIHNSQDHATLQLQEEFFVIFEVEIISDIWSTDRHYLKLRVRPIRECITNRWLKETFVLLIPLHQLNHIR